MTIYPNRRVPRRWLTAEAERLSALDHLGAELNALAAAGLLREARPRRTGVLDLCSNDYLGYAAQPPEPGVWEARSGAGASRLVCGDDEAHEEAEAALADWLHAETALLFSSGYAANVGMISSLARPGDLIVSDALNHASIIDGCRLSGAEVCVAPHLDVEAVAVALGRPKRIGRAWVVTESYFSMDGDSPDLARLRAICDRHGAALIVDEAHALGVFGPEGRGLCAEAGVEPDVLVGTAGKALGLQGAFVVGRRTLRDWLWNKARSFVFSTGVCPAMARWLARNVGRVRVDEAARGEVGRNARLFREALAGAGDAVRGNPLGPIVPWVVGEPDAALRVSARLAAQGVFVQAIRPPTVPRATARLRLTARAGLTPSELQEACRVLRAVASAL